MNKKIAIIGSGWTGIGCISILANAPGITIDVYDSNDDVGGIWNPQKAYAGLSIHGPAVPMVEYFDFPLPSNIDRLGSMTAKEIFNYLQHYCRHKNLYQFMQFNTTINRINYKTSDGKYQIYFHKKDETLDHCVEYDYVIYTQGFSGNFIPDIPGSRSIHRRNASCI